MSTKININVNVSGKVASAIGAPTIVCGNSNYTITFALDSEWETSRVKTARFVYRQDGEVKYIDIAFSGRIVGVPALSNIDEVFVGVYAGELYTSTPARIVCKKSILCGAQKHEEPAHDVYQQILQTINNLETLPTVTSVDAGRLLMVNENGRWVVRLPNFIYDQNSGELIRFFIGTVEEWEAWEDDKNNVIFFPLDLNVLDEVEAAFEKLENGEIIVGKALEAGTAETAKTAETAETANKVKALECEAYEAETVNGSYMVAIPDGKTGLYVTHVRDLANNLDYTGLVYITDLERNAIGTSTFWIGERQMKVSYNANQKRLMCECDNFNYIASVSEALILSARRLEIF